MERKKERERENEKNKKNSQRKNVRKISWTKAPIQGIRCKRKKERKKERKMMKECFRKNESLKNE